MAEPRRIPPGVTYPPWGVKWRICRLLPDHAEVASDAGGHRVIGRVAVFGEGERPPEQNRRLVAAPLFTQQRAQVVGEERDLGVIRAEQVLLERQRLAVQRLSAPGLPAGVLDGCQIVQLDGDLVPARWPAGPAGGESQGQFVARLVV